VTQQQFGQAAKGRDRKALAACDQHVFAQLDRAARDADHDQRFEDAVIGTAQLVPVDHRYAKHKLDLLLERVERLAADRSNGQRGAEAGRDGGCAAEGAGGGDAAAGGTDELAGQSVAGVRPGPSFRSLPDRP